MVASGAPHVGCALLIGGLDPGGGAGVVADLRAVAFAGAFGAAVVAVQTVQSTSGLRSVTSVAARLVVSQASEVLRHQRVRAVKLGALGSLANVRALAALLRRHPSVPVVLDTPMRPSLGRGRARLLSTRAAGALRELLLPLSTLVTVNADEASALTGERVRTVGEAHDAARWLVTSGGARAALVKGGHLEDASAVDVLSLRGPGANVIELRAHRLPGPGAHGTGCTFASLVAGRLAVRAGPASASVRDEALIDAVRWAKRVHHAALARPIDVGGHSRVIVFGR